MYTIEEFDKAKTAILKYVIYKKRTEQEIEIKFKPSIEENLLEDVIQELKQIGYISDEQYVERAIAEYKQLRALSLKEIIYKLRSKGIKQETIDNYWEQQEEDDLLEYEKQSAQKIARKKKEKDKIEIQQMLKKKGYREESIKKAIEELEEGE